jgi:hypothetical protein
MTLRDRLIYALMLLEIGDDVSICDAHALIQSALHMSDIPFDVRFRISERSTNSIISGVMTDES